MLRYIILELSDGGMHVHVIAGCITCLCPCITFGQIAEIIDRGSTCKSLSSPSNKQIQFPRNDSIWCYVLAACGASGALYTLILCLTGCQCIYSCFYRSKMRGQYSLHESPCNDCLVHCCCETCALCQEYRELKTRGFDMNIGMHTLHESCFILSILSKFCLVILGILQDGMRTWRGRGGRGSRRRGWRRRWSNQP